MSSELEGTRNAAYYMFSVSVLLSIWQDIEGNQHKIQEIKTKLKHLDATVTVRNAAYYIKEYEAMSRQSEQLVPTGFEWKKHDPLGLGQSAYLLNYASIKLLDFVRQGIPVDLVLAWVESQNPIDFYAEVNHLQPYLRYDICQQLHMDVKQQSLLYALVADNYGLNLTDFLDQNCSFRYERGSHYLEMIEKVCKATRELLTEPTVESMIVRAEEMLIEVMSVLMLAQEKLRLRLGKEGIGWTDELWKYKSRVDQYMDDPTAQKLVLYLLGDWQMQVDKRFLTGR